MLAANLSLAAAAATGGQSAIYGATAFLAGYNQSVNDESPYRKTGTLIASMGYTTLLGGTALVGLDSIRRTVNTGYISYNDHAGLALGSGPFTIEGLVKFTSAPSAASWYMLCGQCDGPANQAWLVGVFQNNFRFGYSNDGSTLIQHTVAWVPSINTIYHFAVDYDGAAVRLRIGQPGGNSTVLLKTVGSIGTLFDSTAPLTVGATLSSGSPFGEFLGDLDEIRVLRGINVYGTDAAVPVPTLPFPRT